MIKKTNLFTPLLMFLVLIVSCSQESNNTSVIPLIEEVKVPKPRRPVLGWHRVKEGYKAYDYTVLNMLAYFSYKVDPKTGENIRDMNWLSDPILDSAETNNCAIYLTVTNFGYSENTELLNNERACDTLINRLSNMLNQRGAKGVCIDFEEIHEKDGDMYNLFIHKLSTVLRKSSQKLLVVLPISFKENVANAKSLEGDVDYFIMMGYACYHLGSSHAGPISPLRSGNVWEPYNLSDNVDSYLENSFALSKFMVALPLYGAIWETESATLNSRAIKGMKEITYNKVREQFKNQTPTLDSISQSSYYSYEKDGKVMQCWFESEDNLEYKIQFLLNEKAIAGIGFWALGYSDKEPEVWSMVKENI